MEYEGIDLKKISKVYPSVSVRHEDIVTPVSVEWYEQNKDQLQLVHFTLIFLDLDGNRIERHYKDYESMILAMQTIANMLKK